MSEKSDTFQSKSQVVPCQNAETSSANGGETHQSRNYSNNLFEKHKEEIIRQYEVPNTKFTAVDILRWATPLEALLMTFGVLLAIVWGFTALQDSSERRRCNAFDDNCHG